MSVTRSWKGNFDTIFSGDALQQAKIVWPYNRYQIVDADVTTIDKYHTKIGRGGGAERLFWALNQLCPYKDMLCVHTAVEWCRAGTQGQESGLRCWLYIVVHCWEPETEQLDYEDDPLCPSSYILSLIITTKAELSFFLADLFLAFGFAHALIYQRSRVRGGGISV